MSQQRIPRFKNHGPLSATSACDGFLADNNRVQISLQHKYSLVEPQTHVSERSDLSFIEIVTLLNSIKRHRNCSVCNELSRCQGILTLLVNLFRPLPVEAYVHTRYADTHN